MSKKSNTLTTKRFVIRKSLVGTSTIITFTNKKGVTESYDHDEVYNAFKDRFDSMPCFEKYKNYTNSNCIPAFARSLALTK
jgi:hypothetical protein